MNTPSTIPLADAQWIWLPQPQPVVNQYVNFRRRFRLDTPPSSATACISIDTDFVLYVNGSEAARGQFSDYPTRKTYTTIDVARLLRAGENVVAEGPGGLLPVLQPFPEAPVAQATYNGRRLTAT